MQCEEPNVGRLPSRPRTVRGNWQVGGDGQASGSGPARWIAAPGDAAVLPTDRVTGPQPTRAAGQCQWRDWVACPGIASRKYRVIP